MRPRGRRWVGREVHGLVPVGRLGAPSAPLRAARHRGRQRGRRGRRRRDAALPPPPLGRCAVYAAGKVASCEQEPASARAQGELRRWGSCASGAGGGSTRAERGGGSDRDSFTVASYIQGEELGLDVRREELCIYKFGQPPGARSHSDSEFGDDSALLFFIPGLF